MKLQEFRRDAKQASFLIGLVVALIVSGCNSNEFNLAEVTGTVTLDGEPVKGAVVQYIPQSMDGTTSYGLTDEKGHYLMAFTSSADGVMLGQSKVTVSSDDNVAVGGKSYRRVEVFPAKYNLETELTADVVSGSNVIDFECVSDELSRQAMGGKTRRVSAAEEQGF